MAPGARVAIVGAGNGDTAPLQELAERGSLTLLDVDEAALRRGRRRAGQAATAIWDATEGDADAALISRDRHSPPLRRSKPISRIPGGPYDLVVGDLFYSQLLYPALVDRGAPARRRLQVHAPSLTRAVVARMHASAPVVVHVHDALGWWEDHPQPFTLDDALADPALIARGNGPTESDPRHALAALGIPVTATHHWRWPFKDGVDYLLAGTVAGR